MYRGTTPKHTFNFPFDCSEITKLSLVYVQEDVVIIEKVLSDCEFKGSTLWVTLSEEEALKFDSTKRYAELQLRVGCGDKRLATKIFKLPIDRILKDGVLE
jgi:hypothetical protein